jgi:N-formylglutamate amidohydrolase
MIKKLIRSKPKNPVIITVPHSGNFYPDIFLNNFKKNIKIVRKMEDFESDKILDLLDKNNADIIIAKCSRAVVDLNRSRHSIDNSMFFEVVEKGFIQEQKMVDYGLGVIPKKSYNEFIFLNKLSASYANHILKNYYDPFHNILSKQINRLLNTFGICIHIDLHTMPSKALLNYKKQTDIVLGNNFGKSCSKEIFNYFKNIFISHGYSVEVNNPYAGGFITRNYGHPSLGVNTIQIEINRNLYMNEKKLTVNKNIIKIQKSFCNIFNDFHFDFKLAAQ